MKGIVYNMGNPPYSKYSKYTHIHYRWKIYHKTSQQNPYIYQMVNTNNICHWWSVVVIWFSSSSTVDSFTAVHVSEGMLMPANPNMTAAAPM